MGYRFDAAYREPVTLADGRVVELRLVRPEDKELLARGFHRMSPESRYRRFFEEKDKLSPWELAYLTEVDQESHFAMGAVEPLPDGSEEGRGIARFVRLQARPEVAEVAVAVDDAVQGQGLGRILFQRVCQAARERGITKVRCEVLAFNEPMRALVEALHPEVVEESGPVVALEFPLSDVEEAALRGHPLYRLLTMVAGGLVAVGRALRLVGSRGEAEARPSPEKKP